MAEVPNEEAVVAAIRHIVKEVTGTHAPMSTGVTRFDVLGLDALTLMEVAITAEVRFQMSISDAPISVGETLGGLAREIRRLLALRAERLPGQRTPPE
jgi:acyl carrier protein